VGKPIIVRQDPPGARSTILALLFIVCLLNYLDRYALAILLPAIGHDLHLSDTQLGFLSGTAFGTFYALLGIPIGIAADRYSRRRVLGLALAAWSALTAACGLAQTFTQLALARVLLGSAEAGATPPAHATIAQFYRSEERAFALSLFSMGLPVGLLLAFAGGGLLAESFGWRTTLILFGLPGLLLAIPVLRLLPEQSVGGEQDGPHLQRPLRTMLSALVRNRAFVHLSLGSSFFTTVWLGLVTWLPSWLTRDLGMPLAKAGFGLAMVLGFSQLLGLAAGGAIADRLSRRDRRWPLWLCALASLLAPPLLIVALGATTPLTALILLFPAFVVGLLQGGPAVSTVQALADPAERGFTIALYLLVVNLISGMGAQLIGLLSDALGAWAGRPALSAAMSAVASVFCCWSAFHFWRAARWLAAPRMS
jgi:predicted MFS family arabinose efflux permease